MRAFRLMFTVLALITLTASLFAADQQAEDLYKSKCQGCHGPTGRASVIGKKLGAKDFQDPDVAKLSQAERAKIIADGKNKMPPYKSVLTDEQIKALAKYIREMK